ncbi:MAG: hypothetical protein QGH39_10685, partial [Candidatus Thermoplasmatota archaeon]|nr:hypothetical protein [Candidatus Thermoplasmatota archaeon]MDP7266010.1 hypothetical protein [Candidatus Thermoplasmatota archaeon]
MSPRIFHLIREHEKYRSSGLNLIASENYLSPKVREALASDLAGRYHAEWYGGTCFSRQIISVTEELAREVFRVNHAIVTPLSGNICDLTALFSYTSPGEFVAMLPFSVGGYPFGLERFHRKRVEIPADPSTYDIDVDSTLDLITAKKVKLVILGSSFILFPQPVREICQRIDELDQSVHCVYDGSHVLGLMACGEFQDPIREGAEVLFGSTHKTFYGPQGGIMLTDSDVLSDRLRCLHDIDIDAGIGLVDNVHMNRVAALGIAMEEILADKDYGQRVIGNAKKLATVLDEFSLPVLFKEKGFTESHQILLDLPEKTAEKFCHKLERSGIFIDIGARIGVAEITHRGMGMSDMNDIGELIADVYHNGSDEKIKKRVRKLADRFICSE